jgi:hypothetical protein
MSQKQPGAMCRFRRKIKDTGGKNKFLRVVYLQWGVGKVPGDQQNIGKLCGTWRDSSNRWPKISQEKKQEDCILHLRLTCSL